MVVKDGLSDAFFNLSAPTAYSSTINRLRKATGTTSKQVEQFLESEPAWNLHKQVRYRHKRKHTSALFLFSNVQMDLIDLKGHAKRQRYKFILNLIDVYSRFAFSRPLRTKSGQEVVLALKEIFTEAGMLPSFVCADRGKEWLNKHVSAYFEENHIKLIHSSSHLKAAVVERFNRTLRGRMAKYMTENRTRNWEPALQPLISAINRSYHRTIRCTPQEAFAREKVPAGTTRVDKRQRPFRYSIGDKVRLLGDPSVYRRGHYSGWTNEIFTISEQIDSEPQTYRVVDERGEELTGTFYSQEFVRVLQ